MSNNTKVVYDNEKAKRLYEEGKHKAEEAYHEGKQKAENVYQEGKHKVEQTVEEGKDKAQDYYQQAKESASELYNESKKIVNEARDYLQANSDEVINAVKEKPLSSLLIAGGIGFVLYNLIRK